MLSSLKIRTKWVAVLVGSLALLLSLNMYWFYTWRKDQPPDNPGGPLEGMGEGVKLWRVIVLLSPCLIIPLIAGVINLLTPDAARANRSFRQSVLLIAAVALCAPLLMPRPLSLQSAAVVLSILSAGNLLLRALAGKKHDRIAAHRLRGH